MGPWMPPGDLRQHRRFNDLDRAGRRERSSRRHDSMGLSRNWGFHRRHDPIRQAGDPAKLIQGIRDARRLIGRVTTQSPEENGGCGFI